MASTTIRDLREKKNLSQDKVAEAAGLTYSQFVRIEEGSGKTTPDEIKQVLAVLQKMEPGKRKLGGRPFKDPARQAAVLAARASGGSVHEAIVSSAPTTAPAKPAAKATPAKPAAKKAAPAKPAAKKAAPTKDSVAKALAKKAPARARK